MSDPIPFELSELPEGQFWWVPSWGTKADAVIIDHPPEETDECCPCLCCEWERGD